MNRRATIGGERFTFSSLAEVMGKANEKKAGDELAGLAASSSRERIAAKFAIAETTAADLIDEPLVEDAVTEAIHGSLDRGRFDRELGSLTIGEFRELVLHPDFAARWRRERLDEVIPPELAAASAKLMSDLDLMLAAAPLRTVTRCRSTVGERGVLASRIQPNHPVDDLDGIAVTVLDGLMMGCGDALIGVNPAIESVESIGAILGILGEIIDRLEVPTQGCVLAHVSTQLEALARGVKIDIVFQSVGGTEDANKAFGISLDMLGEAQEAALAQHREAPGRYIGEQVMYFETGQGSALTAAANQGVDQLTCEARAQAVARLYDPFLVNSVVGFIGPEYLADARQISRAGLEDHFVGKLMGLPMGCDVCYTNHVEADQNSNDDLLVMLASAGCNFVMAVPAGDDVMLGYQSTSCHDVASVRGLLGLRPTPEFERWLLERDAWQQGRGVRTEQLLDSSERLLLPLMGEPE
ncbi:MAG: ethanolamine ammonia-lyase subunit EutB [Actinobacteria bacterium]|nr:ethanolamine ammonia-lyase subunit EutB [Actinomycetota bacterium]